MRKPFKLQGRKGYFLNIEQANGKAVRKKIGDTKEEADRWIIDNLQSESVTDTAYAARQWLTRAIISEIKGVNFSKAELKRLKKSIRPFSVPKKNPLLKGITATLFEDWFRGTSLPYRSVEYAVIDRLIRWAKLFLIIAESQMEGSKPPSKKPKEITIIPESDYLQTLEVVSSQARRMLTVLWHTGARPWELASLQATSVASDLSHVILKDEARPERKPRIIYLNSAAREALRENMSTDPGEYVFLNTDGHPWSIRSLEKMLDRAWAKRNQKRKTQDDSIVRVTLDAFRHTYINRALAADVPSANVAELTGASLAMIERTYGHLSRVKRYLVSAVERVM